MSVYGIEDIRREYDRLDRLCRADTSRMEIRLNNASRRLGSFQFRPGFPRGTMTVTISRKVLDDEALFFDTIRHEYAHALVHLRHPFSRHGHDRVWKAACREVGCTPRATVKDAALKERAEANARYKVTCMRCGAETFYMRAGKIVQMLQREADRRGPYKKVSSVACRRCGSREFSVTVLK